MCQSMARLVPACSVIPGGARTSGASGSSDAADSLFRDVLPWSRWQGNYAYGVEVSQFQPDVAHMALGMATLPI